MNEYHRDRRCALCGKRRGDHSYTPVGPACQMFEPVSEEGRSKQGDADSERAASRDGLRIQGQPHPASPSSDSASADLDEDGSAHGMDFGGPQPPHDSASVRRQAGDDAVADDWRVEAASLANALRAVQSVGPLPRLIGREVRRALQDYDEVVSRASDDSNTEASDG